MWPDWMNMALTNGATNECHLRSRSQSHCFRFSFKVCQWTRSFPRERKSPTSQRKPNLRVEKSIVTRASSMLSYVFATKIVMQGCASSPHDKKMGSRNLDTKLLPNAVFALGKRLCTNTKWTRGWCRHGKHCFLCQQRRERGMHKLGSGKISWREKCVNELCRY